MTVFISASKGCEAAAEKYIRALEAMGHRAAGGSAKDLLASDGLFVLLADGDDSDVKADLNLALDRGLPVAFAEESGAVKGSGLELQLGLAKRIDPASPQEGFGEWLEAVKKAPKKKQGGAGKIIAAVLAVAVIAGAAIGIGSAKNKAPEVAPPEPQPTAEELYFGGQAAEELVTLDLSGRDLTDISFLSEAVNLEELDLSGNLIEDISPVAGLSKLRRLDISYNKISDINPLLAVKSLEELDISGNDIEDLTALDFMEGVTVINEKTGE